MQTLDTFSSSVIVNEISSKDFSLHCDFDNHAATMFAPTHMIGGEMKQRC